MEVLEVNIRTSEGGGHRFAHLSDVPRTEALSLLQRPRVRVLAWGPLLRVTIHSLNLFPVMSPAVLSIKNSQSSKRERERERERDRERERRTSEGLS